MAGRIVETIDPDGTFPSPNLDSEDQSTNGKSGELQVSLKPGMERLRKRHNLIQPIAVLL